MSVGLLIISHDDVGQALLDASCAVLDSCPFRTEVAAIHSDQDIDKINKLIEEKVLTLDNGDGVLVLTDMYGATPSNIVCSLSHLNIGIVSGMNMPMLIRIMNYPSLSLLELIEKAIRNKGFSVVEIMSNCHVQFGRRNKMADPVTMLNWFKDHAISRDEGTSMPPDSLHDKFTIGILADEDKPNYIEEYSKIRKRAKRN